MTAYLQRAQLLIQQSRYNLAEEQLRMALAEDSSDATAHALLAICLNEREAFAEATDEARQAIFHAPDEGIGHYALAHVMLERNRLPEARQAVSEAIRLEPWNSSYFATLGSIEAKALQWQKCLDAADSGLEADPEDADCANLRSLALTKLGRKEEAGLTIAEQLRQTPDDDFTHANEGWRQLHLRNPQKAMQHFQEALRLNPMNAWAKQGIIEAMKARNFIYRWMLTFFLWMNGFSPRVQLALMLGFVLGQNLLISILNAIPFLAPFSSYIVIAYALFVWMSWSCSTLFNLVLLTSPFGRLALAPAQKVEAWLAGGCVLLCLLSAGIMTYYHHGSSNILEFGILHSLLLLGLTIPVVAAFRRTGRRRKAATAWAIGVFLVVLQANNNIITLDARVARVFVNSFPVAMQPQASEVANSNVRYPDISDAINAVVAKSRGGSINPLEVGLRFKHGTQQIGRENGEWFIWALWGIMLTTWLDTALALIPERR